VRHGVVQVEVGPGTTARPASMSPRTASEIVQQAVWTFRDASGRRDAQVQFFREGVPAASVFGIPATEPIAQGRVVDVLSPVNISTPTDDGRRFARGRLAVSGTDHGFEGTVVVTLVRRTASGQHTVLTKSGPADGAGDPDRLYPWKVTLDTSHLRPGPYTVVATEDDPSGHGDPATDTRVVVLE
jgi:Immunoglobulin-like domain of bacterial spore germination